MRNEKAWSILAMGILAAACGGSAKPEAKAGLAGGRGIASTATDSSNAFPESGPAEEATASSAPELDVAPSGAGTPSPAPAPTTGARDEAPAARDADKASADSRGAPAKKSRPFELEPERPGLGTTWGETRTSRVENAPFERASSNPFSLTTIRYNDQVGISAMLRGASPADFRTDAAVVAGGFVSVRLVDASGAPLPTFASGTNQFAQGEVGQRYIIELVNQSSNRFEAVVTVDGLDVMDGKPGSFAKRGYLLQPFATVDIDGFRQSMDEVAAFRFGSVRGSYAAQKGNDRNVGVIGVALFAERGANVWSDREIRRRETADPFPGRFATPPVAR